MKRLQQLKKKYNKVVRALNRAHKAHVQHIAPIKLEKERLYREIYDLSAIPTQEMMRRVETKLTKKEKLYARVLWNTPPDIRGLERVWYDD